MKNFLAVIDMQNDFIDGALGTDEARQIVTRVAQKIQRFNGVVFATLDTHYDNYLETNEGRRLPVKHCIKGSDGWLLNPEIAAALAEKGGTTVEKPSFGSFELARLIKEAAGGEELSIELVGLCTDICVVSNALILKAAFPEAEISIDSSCCAGVTPQSHEAAVATMRSCQISDLAGFEA